jgi:hypothetical protein
MKTLLAIYGAYHLLGGGHHAPRPAPTSSSPTVFTQGCAPISYSASCELPWAGQIPQCKCDGAKK